MKFSIFAIVFALLSGNAFAAKNPGGLEVCSKELPVKEIYKDNEELKIFKGLCLKSDNKEKWVVEPLFQKLVYSKDSNIYYGWKFNDKTGKSDFDRTKEDANKYGHMSSAIFSSDGSKRIELAGKIDDFEGGYGSIFIGEEPTVLGMDSNDVQNSAMARNIAIGYLGVDYFLSSVASAVQYSMLMDEPIYRSISENYYKTQKVGFIDANGKIVIEPKFLGSAWTTSFETEYAIVMGENRKFGLINKKGEYVIEPKYKKLYYGSKQIHGSKKTNKNAFLGRKLTCEYLTCVDKTEIIDPKNLKIIDTYEKTTNKLFIMRLINGEKGVEINEENIVLLGIGMSLMGAIALWPFCIAYQRAKKKSSWKKSIFAGFGWGWLITVGAVVGTFLLLILFVLIFFSGGMLGTIMAQKD